MVIKNDAPGGLPEQRQNDKTHNIQSLEYQDTADEKYQLRFDFFWESDHKSSEKTHHPQAQAGVNQLYHAAADNQELSITCDGGITHPAEYVRSCIEEKMP